MRKYLVCAPGYRENSAGVRVLHRLCHDLNKILGDGHAFLSTQQTRPYANTPWIGDAGVDAKDLVIVAPEIMTDSSIACACFVRFALNKPGLLGGPARYASHEMVWTYTEALLPFVSEACGREIGPERVLRVPSIDRAVFNLDGAGDRYLDLEYCRKDGSFPERGHGFMAKAIITREYPADKIQLAQMLKSAKSLTTYDDYSVLIDEARLCGCPVTVVPSENFMGVESYKGFICGDGGLTVEGHGFDTLDRLDECAAVADEREAEYDMVIWQFIEETQNWTA